jgi:hypothetical protein
MLMPADETQCRFFLHGLSDHGGEFVGALSKRISPLG